MVYVLIIFILCAVFLITRAYYVKKIEFLTSLVKYEVVVPNKIISTDTVEIKLRLSSSLYANIVRDCKRMKLSVNKAINNVLRTHYNSKFFVNTPVSGAPQLKPHKK